MDIKCGYRYPSGLLCYMSRDWVIHDSAYRDLKLHHAFGAKGHPMTKTKTYDLINVDDRAELVKVLNTQGSWVNSLSALVEKMGGTIAVELPIPDYVLKDDGGGCRVVQEESGHIYFLNEQNRAALGFLPSELDGLIARLQELKGE